MSTVLAIPDMHIPFHHPMAFTFIKWAIDRFKPDEVVLMGDELDWHGMSFHQPENNAMSGYDEYELAQYHTEDLWRLLPDQGKGCYSNHGSLPQRKMKAHGLVPQILHDYKTILGAPDGWFWDERHVIDGVQYIHGQNIGLKTSLYKCVDDHKMSTVFGHVHAYGGVQYRETGAGTFFGLNTGCLIDHQAYAFSYSKLYAERPTLGLGIVIDGEEAYFIPMNASQFSDRYKT